MDALLLIAIIVGLIAAAIPIAIWVLVVRAICKHAAKKNAEAFNYDYLANKIADEIYKRLMIIEKQKSNKEEALMSEDQITIP